MSVRRLAKEQPASFAFSDASLKEVEFWLAKYPVERKASAVIPLLWIAQKQEGWVSEPAIQRIAAMLDMAVIRVLEVATFYTMFHLAPVGKHHVQVCGTTPCMLRGAEALKDICRKRIGAAFEVTADAKLSWEEVECIGACVNAPAVIVHDYFHEDLSPEAMEALIDALARDEVPAPGPRVARQRSAPEGGADTLQDPSLYDGTLAAKLTLPNLPEPAQS